MYRLLLLFAFICAFASCKKDPDDTVIPPTKVPDIIIGFVTEFSVEPQDITTPKDALLLVDMNNTFYKVEFSVADQSEYNAQISFETDTILTTDSREFASFGADIVAYRPLHENEIEIVFTDNQRKITAIFDDNSYFAGVFGQSVISGWRDTTDPLKPNEKGKNEITELIRRYSDTDGAGPGTTPALLSVKVSLL